MEKALSLISYKESLEAELHNWRHNARDGVISPLTFRLGGKINYMSKEAFEQFRSASILHLRAIMCDLDADFATL